MIEIDIRQLMPRFLMDDKNGRAMAKAIERAMILTDEVIQAGLDTLLDVEKMPEWRLDEMAREYNVLYDFAADAEAKRAWIRDAFPMYRVYGTPEAIYQYLRGVFDEVEVEEWWQYGAAAYHFRVIVAGEWTDAKEAWARYAIRVASNIRSVLDDISVGTAGGAVVRAESAKAFKFYYPLAGDELCGTLP